MKLYNVNLTLEHDEVSNGTRHQTTLPVSITVFSENQTQARMKAVSTLPTRLQFKVSDVRIIKLLGETNRQLQTILRR